jgi:hypothetical protein
METKFLKYFKLTFALLLFLQLGYSQESQNSTCIGRTVLNSTGGTTAANGLKIITTGSGILQVFRLGVVQISTDDLDAGTSQPFDASGGLDQINLIIGNGYFSNHIDRGFNVIIGLTRLGTFTIVSNTCQASVGPLGGTQQNTVRLAATTGGLTYYLNVIYNYVFPNNFLSITYTVEIPASNTQSVKVAQGFDTYLGKPDNGFGFISGVAPYLKMGVQKTGFFQAFNYISGVPWSGYYSARSATIYDDLGSDGKFNNTIDTASHDNGIGISMDFGSTPGTYSSVNSLSFSCAAPSTAPSLSPTSLPNTCPANTANLNNLYTGTLASGLELRWFKSTGEPYATPTQAVAGSYYAIFYDTIGGCYSPVSATVNVNVADCCPTVAPNLN